MTKWPIRRLGAVDCRYRCFSRAFGILVHRRNSPFEIVLFLIQNESFLLLAMANDIIEIVAFVLVCLYDSHISALVRRLTKELRDPLVDELNFPFLMPSFVWIDKRTMLHRRCRRVGISIGRIWNSFGLRATPWQRNTAWKAPQYSKQC